jgi:predicted PurR-regulated permease PerM
MKKHIEKIKAKGPEHVSRVSKILAGITTLIIATIWIVLVFVFDTSEDEQVEPSNGPDIENFLQQAENSIKDLGNDFESGAQQLQQIAEEVENDEDIAGEEITVTEN